MRANRVIDVIAVITAKGDYMTTSTTEDRNKIQAHRKICVGQKSGPRLSRIGTISGSSRGSPEVGKRAAALNGAGLNGSRHFAFYAGL